VHRYISY